MGLAEKYRPKNLEEVLGQEKVVMQLEKIVAGVDYPNLLLTGPAGCGKTSIAFAFANETELPIFETNASDERGIDTVREKIKRLAFTTGKRIIFLDEFDSMTGAAQHALRRVIEKSSSMFILTANEPHKIIDPIKSRCVIYNLSKLNDRNIAVIVTNVLRGEGIELDEIREKKDAIKYLVERVNGDARRALNCLDALLIEGLDITKANIEAQFPSNSLKEIMQIAYEGKWGEAIESLGSISNIEGVEGLYNAISELELPRYKKLKLYEKLGDVERNLKIGCNPTVQLTSFLSTIYVSKQSEGVEED